MKAKIDTKVMQIEKRTISLIGDIIDHINQQPGKQFGTLLVAMINDITCTNLGKTKYKLFIIQIFIVI